MILEVSVYGQLNALFLGCGEAEHNRGCGRTKLLTYGGPEAENRKEGAEDKVYLSRV
jgi:hypothetical protein